MAFSKCKTITVLFFTFLLCFLSRLTAAEGPFEVRTRTTKIHHFSSPFNLRVNLTNKGTANFLIQDIKVFFEHDPEQFRLQKCHDPEIELIEVDEKGSVELCASKIRLAENLLEEIFFRGGAYKGEIIVSFKPEDAQSFSEENIPFEVGPVYSRSWIVVVGALIGLCATGLFQYFYLKWRAIPVQISVWLILLAISTVAISVFLIRESAASASLPVRVQVNDIYGGVILGFFFRPLIDWLADILLGPEHKPIRAVPSQQTPAP